MIPSYSPLETKQLLSESFFRICLRYKEIWVHRLKWPTLYIGLFSFVKIFIVYIYIFLHTIYYYLFL